MQKLSIKRPVATLDTSNQLSLFTMKGSGEPTVLIALASTGEVDILVPNYKDLTDDARQWLRQPDDPYTVIAVDADGRVGIDRGMYGVPE